MLIVVKPCERLRNARIFSSYGALNVPKLTQPYTRLISVHIFYCAVAIDRSVSVGLHVLTFSFSLANLGRILEVASQALISDWY